MAYAAAARAIHTAFGPPQPGASQEEIPERPCHLKRRRGKGRNPSQDPDRLLREMRAGDQDLEGVSTPYGSLFKTCEAPSSEEGEKNEIYYLCPFGFLHYGCELSIPFGEFLEVTIDPSSTGFSLATPDVLDRGSSRASPGEPPKGRITIYGDEVTPGNNLRPDIARSYLAVYWTFLEFPEWFRNKQNGWFCACLVSELCTFEVSAHYSCTSSKGVMYLCTN